MGAKATIEKMGALWAIGSARHPSCPPANHKSLQDRRHPKPSVPDGLTARIQQTNLMALRRPIDTANHPRSRVWAARLASSL
ncbi:hypothetical protein IE4872_PD01738 (plasmid) [Rhizobium gallicum]|uniref:Uncharacterized protein n=1 Tax=Rhizobium gallicum TaxID=56730 RepID=A0A1L5NWH5_9HYPH|nr:hypothetical protein IE4872_PD01738 [Rhizobium gallicum]